MEQTQQGQAERFIGVVTNFIDHMVHNRPGVVTFGGSGVGATWEPGYWKEENGVRNLYRRVGKRGVLMGVLDTENRVRRAGRVIAEYRKPGLFPEVAAYIYRQVAEIYKLDQEFVARWASYAYKQENRDLKILLAAFLLVQDRKGSPITFNGETVLDDDYREVAEAMCLRFSSTERHALSPKMLLRVGELLALPQIAQINRELGFGQSGRNPMLGRYKALVTKWLRYREENTQLLDGLVKAGMRNIIVKLATTVRYKPTTDAFFRKLRWKQSQAEGGHREMLIGAAVEAAESWDDLSEVEICEKIVAERPNYKRIVGLVPNGVTPAIMSAAIEADVLSAADLIIYLPTIESLGLMSDVDVKAKVEAAYASQESQRALRIAKRVRNVATKEALEAVGDKVVKDALKESTRDLKIYIGVDISGSMSRALIMAKDYVARFLQAIPKEQLVVAVFNSVGREVVIKGDRAVDVQKAFSKFSAGGGTNMVGAIRVFEKYPPKDNEDVLMLWITDEGAVNFPQAVRDSGLRPNAFGLIKDGSWHSYRGAITATAQTLGIPCFNVDTAVFDDVYNLPRVLRNLIESTPVGAGSRRETLVDKILKTDLLEKPLWAT